MPSLSVNSELRVGDPEIVFELSSSDALRTALPLESKRANPNPKLAIGGDQLRNLAMPTEAEITLARARLHRKAVFVGLTVE